MKKSLVALTMGAFALSANAETFFVDVEFVENFTALTLTESTPMSFPVLARDEATEDGATCDLNAANTGNNVTSLCPGLSGQQAEIAILGTPNAAVTVTYAADETQAGLRFQNNAGSTPEVVNSTLDTTGQSSFTAGGLITLVDKSAAAAGTYQFSYDVTVAYQ